MPDLFDCGREEETGGLWDEMEELERLCDRVLILSDGEMKKELSRKDGDLITEAALTEAVQTA